MASPSFLNHFSLLIENLKKYSRFSLNHFHTSNKQETQNFFFLLAGLECHMGEEREFEKLRGIQGNRPASFDPKTRQFHFIDVYQLGSVVLPRLFSDFPCMKPNDLLSSFHLFHNHHMISQFHWTCVRP
jgi:hypothetical protein